MKNILPVFIILIFMQCASKNAADVALSQNYIPKTAVVADGKTAENAERISLRLGDNAFSEKGQMNITFTRVVEDERENGGNAIVEIEAMLTYSRPTKILLALKDTDKAQKTAEFGKSFITLENLFPAEKSEKSNENSYKIDLKITPVLHQ